MTDPLISFQCGLCYSFFEDLVKGTIHMANYHSSVGSHHVPIIESIDKSPTDYLKATVFQNCNISLERLTLHKSSPIMEPEQSFPHPNPLIKIRDPRTVRTDRLKTHRREIKLDTLKAGEMETLIHDLFQETSTLNSCDLEGEEEGQSSRIRKSNRKIKPRFIRCYGDLDSEDEEIIRTGGGGPYINTKAAGGNGGNISSRDDVYKDPDDEDYSDFEGESLNFGRKKTKCRRSKVIQDEVSITNRDVDSKDPSATVAKSKLKKARKKSKSKVTKPRHDHKCDICGKTVQTVNLPKHLNYHKKKSAPDPNKPHVCPICQHRFADQVFLRRHFVTHLENNPYECKFSGCGKTFSCTGTLRRHVALHTDRQTFNCDKCPAKYTEMRLLTRHNERYHSENSTEVYSVKKPYFYVKSAQVLVPDFALPPPKRLKSKIPTPDEDNRFELESIHLADRIIIAPNSLQEIHVKGETLSPIKRPFSPGLPLKLTLSPTGASQTGLDLDRSENFESDNETIDPDLEPDMITAEEDLEPDGSPKFGDTNRVLDIILSDPVLKKLQENNPEGIAPIISRLYPKPKLEIAKPFKCPTCPWSSSKSYWLEKHVSKYHGEFAVNSNSTSANNSAPSKFKRRIRPFYNRSGRRMPVGMTATFSCGTCGYQSESAADLATHISKVHVGNKKFHCSFCGLRFVTKSRRDLHQQQIHLTEKTFSCGKCELKFSDEKHRHKHMLYKHNPKFTEEKKPAFKCKKCERHFTKKSGYKQHLKLHTGEAELTTCKICRRTCVDIYSLKRHIQSIHVGIPNPYEARKRLRLLSETQKAQKKIGIKKAIDASKIKTDSQNAVNNCGSSGSENISQNSETSDAAQILGF